MRTKDYADPLRSVGHRLVVVHQSADQRRHLALDEWSVGSRKGIRGVSESATADIIEMVGFTEEIARLRAMLDDWMGQEVNEDAELLLELLGLGAVPEWTRALLWPAHLQADYGPFEIVPWHGWTMAQSLGTALLIGLVALMLWSWRRRPVTAFGILWTVIALAPVSNVFVTTGVIVAERTLTLPSVGLLIALVGLLPTDIWDQQRLRGAFAVAAGALLLLGGLRSMQRLGVWHDADRYVLALDRDAPDSWHTQVAVGILALQQGDRAEGEKRLRTAIGMWPHHARAYKVLATQYRTDGLCAPAIPLYLQAIVLEPIDQYSRLSLVSCLLDVGRYADAAVFADSGAAGPGRALQEAFRAARATADSAARAHAAPGTVRLAPYPGGSTTIGAAAPRPATR